MTISEIKVNTKMDRIAKDLSRLLLGDYIKQFNNVLYSSCSSLYQMDSLHKMVQYYVNNIGDEENILSKKRENIFMFTNLNNNKYQVG